MSKSQIVVKSSKMREKIVGAALRRFTHFGIAKTTLTEVAEDQGISKQVLSYYFPDKQSLIDAVVEKLGQEYGSLVRTALEQARTVEEGLLSLTTVKGGFFEKYFMLIGQAEHLESIRQRSLQSWRSFLAGKESGLVTRLFENGMQTGELKQLDAAKTAMLFLDTLQAFSSCVKEKSAFPDATAFGEMLFKQREVIKIFYQGLKSASWKN